MLFTVLSLQRDSPSRTTKSFYKQWKRNRKIEEVIGCLLYNTIDKLPLPARGQAEFWRLPLGINVIPTNFGMHL